MKIDLTKSKQCLKPLSQAYFKVSQPIRLWCSLVLRENSWSLHEFIHPQLKKTVPNFILLNYQSTFLVSFQIQFENEKDPTISSLKITNKRILEIDYPGRGKQRLFGQQNHFYYKFFPQKTNDQSFKFPFTSPVVAILDMQLHS